MQCLHGPSNCQVCFKTEKKLIWNSSDYQIFEKTTARWRLRRNPAYWGAADPEILVLGFSKGPEQNRLIEQGTRFEDIPFNDRKRQMRNNLQRILSTIGLIDAEIDISKLFESTETRFGFASLVRCSVETFDHGKWIGTAGNIMAKTINSNPPFVSTCITTHLSNLPESVRLIVLLGVTIGYVRGVRNLLGGVQINPSEDYVYEAMERLCIHVPHPAGGNNGAISVFCGVREPQTPSEANIPACRSQIIRALQNYENSM